MWRMYIGGEKGVLIHVSKSKIMREIDKVSLREIRGISTPGYMGIRS